MAELCILGHPPLVPLHLQFSSPFFSPPKHFDCHLTPPRLIFLERRKPPFFLLLIWPQPKPMAAFPARARCSALQRSAVQPGRSHHWSGVQGRFEGCCSLAETISDTTSCRSAPRTSVCQGCFLFCLQPKLLPHCTAEQVCVLQIIENKYRPED